MSETEFHHDTTAKLVYMANQISKYFASQPGGMASIGTADHLKSFWSPTMLRDIYKHLDATGGQGLAPVALESIRILKASIKGGDLQDVLAAHGEHSGREPGDDAG